MSIRERTAKAEALLAILATTPAFIFDLVSYRMFGEYRLHPLLVEQLLLRRGQYDGSVSIKDNLRRHYGKDASELAEELI